MVDRNKGNEWEVCKMHDYRPEMSLPKTTLQKIANGIGYGVFIISVLYSILNLPTLPSDVPIHFNFAGEVDGWGSKYVLLLLPFIGVVTVLALAAVEKRPHMHNYPQHINETNVRQFYEISIRTANLIKSGTLIIFGLLQIEIVLAAKESSVTFGNILFGAMIVFLILPIAWHIYSMVQLKPTKENSNGV